ncbi:MAG: Ykof family thiamine-binding protein [Caldisericaceae bacterium]
MLITAQFSIYPLRVENYGDYVYETVRIVKSFGLDVEIGPTSSITYGESETVLKAFNEVMEKLGGKIHFVFVITVSNACPKPGKEEK